VRTLRAAATLTATALLCPAVASCGASSNPGGPNIPASTSPGTAAAPTNLAGPPTPSGGTFLFAAGAAATRALWTVSDFPAGWATTPDTGTDATTAADIALASCLRVPAALLTGKAGDTARVKSPNFNAPTGNATASETVSASAGNRVATLMTALKQPGAIGCLTTLLNTAIRTETAASTDPTIKNATIGSVQLGQLSTGRYGDDTVAFRATIPITAQGLSLIAYIDEIYIRRGGAVASLTFEDVGTAFDTTTQTQLATTAAAKLTAANIPAS
jgi:hypothetical protein